MRAAATTALLAAVALAADEGVELVYEFGEGEAPAAAKVLARRLELLGIEGGLGDAQADGKRVVLRLPSRDRLEDARAAAVRVGRVEFRRVVNPEAPGYRRHRKNFDAALAKGVEPAKACDLPAESLMPEERKLWPGGLRWYRNPKPSEALKEDWVLCEIDGWGITGEAIEDVRVWQPEMHADDTTWAISFGVKEGFRANMAELTSAEGVRLATILDGDVLWAPVLMAQLRERGMISGNYSEREARSIAAVIGGGTLPSKPKLVEERASGS